MKKKLYFIFILITCSMLGIIYFQVDWVHKTYSSEYKKLNEEADDALRNALFDYHRAQEDSVTNFLNSRLAPLYDTVKIKYSNNSDTLFISLKNYKKNNSNWSAMAYRSGISIINISGLESLSNRQAFIHEVLNIMAPLTYETDFTCNPQYFHGDSVLITHFVNKSLYEMGLADMVELADLSFDCGSVPSIQEMALGSLYREYRPFDLKAYTGSKRWVALYFMNHRNKIISRIWIPALLSVILILTCIFSFFYLLKIILQQKRLAEMKDDFINNMTHELKTPIAIISAAVEGMQNFNVLEDKDKTKRYLTTSQQELNRLDNLVTKVLHMASYEKNEIELNIDKIEAEPFVTDIINSFKIHPEKQVTIQFTNSANLKYIHADPVHFRNVLANLIDNAIKYSGSSVNITIACLQEENQVKFTVSDDGLGIPAGQVKHIFEKFHRVPTGNLHAVKGTGLGLSYVKYIMERHGGSVSVQSEVNKGSQFTVALPVL